MPVYVLAFLLGVTAGLRSMTPLAAVAWAVNLGWVRPETALLGGLGAPIAAWFFSLFAAAELVVDKLPKTPSRKEIGPLVARIVVGAVCGATLGDETGDLTVGAIAGALGAVAGTFGGYEFRSRLVKSTGGKDLPIALLEDCIAIAGAIWLVSRSTHLAG